MAFLRVLFVFTIILSISNYQTHALKILGIFPYPGKSHFVMIGALMKELAHRGHQVDVIGHFPLNKPVENYRDLTIQGSRFLLVNNLTYETTVELNSLALNSVVEILGTGVCDLLSHDVFQKLIKNPQSYDILIIEVNFADCYLAFGQHLNTPVVGVLTGKIDEWLIEPFGIPYNPSFTRSSHSGLTKQKTFFERLENFFLYVFTTSKIKYYMEAETEHVQKYFGRKLNSISDLYKDVSLLLINWHHSLDILPSPPGIVEVAGLHVHDSGQEISSDIKLWLDNSHDGFVYFSFGSMVKLETFPHNILDAFYKMFDRIAPVRVLLKVADIDNMPAGIPKNVKLSTWLPQIAILKHKNIKVFITHGGLMGTQEAITYGVPMVGIPIFRDQFINLHAFEQRKIAIVVKLDELTADSLTNAVNIILHDPTYTENVKKMSSLFLDRPMSPMDTAVYWIEYAARHGNVLKSPGSELSWWQNYFFDIYVFCTICILFIIYIIQMLCKLLLKLLNIRKIKNTSSQSKTRGKKNK
ncbi:UDP-glucosyltransferase 2 [Microplitis demolitor]|uniref:UDP-glucosyltransferase 2 n=1 Tax=Microplitis demolitor TaxID=69319 RepID=UPI00044003AD|nr:UDP-glucosyltransferase 2 [Microplitis demolitor]